MPDLTFSEARQLCRVFGYELFAGPPSLTQHEENGRVVFRYRQPFHLIAPGRRAAWVLHG